MIKLRYLMTAQIKRELTILSLALSCQNYLLHFSSWKSTPAHTRHFPRWNIKDILLRLLK